MKRLILFTVMLTIACCTSCDKKNNDGKDDDKNPVDNPINTIKKYVVGNYYNEHGIQGIVYKINSDGTSGMIFSMDETATAWVSDSTFATVQTSTTESDSGMINMEKIKAMGIEHYAAFKWCNDKNKEGVVGWYFPASNELDDIYRAQKNNVNSINDSIIANGGVAFGPVDYWASTEIGSIPPFHSATIINFSSGRMDHAIKTTTHQVRAVRIF
jgi:hypothetical protein